MTTLAARAIRNIYIPDDEEGYPVVAADIIYEGAAVGENGAGYARPLVAGDVFLGFAIEADVDNSAGVAGDKNVRVKTKGRIELDVAGANSVTVNDGPLVYASDDDTFTLTATGNSPIGRVSRWISGTRCVVDFNAKRASGSTSVTALGGTLTGTVDGSLDDVADIALSTSNTYTDAAVNNAVNAAIASVNLQLKEIQSKFNALVADLA